MSAVTFQPNIPQTLSLQDPTGDWDGGYSVFYPTVDGRILTLPYNAACRLNALDLEPGQTFTATRRVKPGEPSYWDFALTAQTEQVKASQEAPDLEAQLAASIQQAQKIRSVPPRKPIQPEQPRLFDRGKGTGTDGPAPLPLPKPEAPWVAVASRRTPPVQIPYNVAFREVARFVSQGLKDEGLQWNDQAVQDAVCTILIAAAKQNLLVLWERQNAQ